MPEKNHKNVIEWHKLKLEEDFHYRCKKEMDLIRNANFHKVDLGCFCPDKNKPAIGVEVESSKNFDSPQIKSNAEDLKEFERIYGGKTFHIHISDTIDFSKELEVPETDTRQDIKNKKFEMKEKSKLPKSRIALGW